MNKQFKMLIIILSAIGWAACASKQPPISAMTKAGVAVKRAEDVNAAEAAPLEMRLAREKLDLAQKDMDQKNYDSAKRNAEYATVQAELAQSKSNLKKSKSKTTDAQQSSETLKNEIEHNEEKGSQ
jgi:predicted component of type VI protein secretion system